MPFKVLVVGSGPVGSAYARLLLEGLPEARVTMVEVGPQLTPVPGMNVRNIVDAAEQQAARLASQGPAATTRGLARPAAVVDGTVTSAEGTFLVAHGGPGSGQADGMPAAALASCVGGQGAHWTCVTPRPYGSERVAEIPDEQWEDAVTEAEGLLHVTHDAFAANPVGQAIRAALSGVFDAGRPAGRKVGGLPVAADFAADGSVRWTGSDTVLGPLADPDSELSSRFALRSRTLCRRLRVEGSRVVGAEVEHLPSGERETLRSDLVVVAADAFRTPQLLWASGIRPAALGRYLTEHPGLLAAVALDDDVVRGRLSTIEPREPKVAALAVVPFSEQHPFHAQLMYFPVSPVPLAQDDPHRDNPLGYVSLEWICRKQPRHTDRVEFSDSECDSWGMPGLSIHYSLTDREHSEIEQARSELARAAGVLGEFVRGGEPRLLPSGSFLHYQGTYRIGSRDDGTCVCDPDSRVWGIDGLVLGGNGLIPTATACNPTLTSVALAVLGARRVVRDHTATIGRRATVG